MLKQQKGFSLVELMIVVMVIGVLVTVGLPSLRYTLHNNRITARTNELIRTLNYARSEAITRGVTQSFVQVAPLDATGNVASEDTTDWSLGWRIWIDLNRNGLAENNLDLIRFVEFSGSDQIAITQTQGEAPLIFTARGIQNQTTFQICTSDTTLKSILDGREVARSLTGRIALKNRELDCSN